MEATDIVIISQKEDQASVECAAIANPQATYGWSRIQGSQVIDITGDLDPRYTLTNGRLTIDQPEEGTDSGRYQCRAENTFGTIIGSIIQLSFGCNYRVVYMSLITLHILPDLGQLTYS